MFAEALINLEGSRVHGGPVGINRSMRHGPLALQHSESLLRTYTISNTKDAWPVASKHTRGTVLRLHLISGVTWLKSIG